MAVPQISLPSILSSTPQGGTLAAPIAARPARVEKGFAAFRLFEGTEPRTLSLMQQVAVAVIERIVDGRYPAGSFLPEHVLADEFRISKAPVSEALVLVGSTGLLENDSRRSARVAAMSLADFDDLVYYRNLLLMPALAGFIERRDAARMALLEGYRDEVEQLVDDDARAFSFVELIDRGALFIALQCGHPRIGRAATQISLQFLRYSYFGFRSTADRRVLFASCRDTVKAIGAGDAQAAIAVGRQVMAIRREAVAARFGDGSNGSEGRVGSAGREGREEREGR